MFRRAPDSFTDQQYYSWMAYEYKAKDGKLRYAKFRLVPQVKIKTVKVATKLSETQT